MLDRESTFADPVIIELLKKDFVPVAIDQWYTRRQKDTEGDFWRKIAGQSPRNDFSKTTQGLFIAGADGSLIAFNNNRGAERIGALLKEASQNYQPAAGLQAIERKTVDPRFTAKLPEGGIVVRVSAKVESGYEKSADKWQTIFQNATSRDNLWVTAAEIKELRADRFPPDLARRIARFHFLDNTRGEATVWNNSEIKKSDWQMKDGQIVGAVVLESDDQKRGYDVRLEGMIKFDDAGNILSWQCIAKGEYFGSSTFTLEPPSGKFPLAVSFVLADGDDIADELAPHASRGWLDGYLRPLQ